MEMAGLAGAAKIHKAVAQSRARDRLTADRLPLSCRGDARHMSLHGVRVRHTSRMHLVWRRSIGLPSAKQAVTAFMQVNPCEARRPLRVSKLSIAYSMCDQGVTSNLRRADTDEQRRLSSRCCTATNETAAGIGYGLIT